MRFLLPFFMEWDYDIRMARPKKTPEIPASIAVQPPQLPSPAVLSLQQQVVDLVSKRSDARSRLTESHTAYLSAQATFQAAQSELQGIEQEVQYRISLIAQLENRSAAIAAPTPPLQFPGTLQGVSVDPAPATSNVGTDDMVSRGHASRAFAAM
jgi:hypothetical protein